MLNSLPSALNVAAKRGASDETDADATRQCTHDQRRRLETGLRPLHDMPNSILV